MTTCFSQSLSHHISQNFVRSSSCRPIIYRAIQRHSLLPCPQTNRALTHDQSSFLHVPSTTRHTMSGIKHHCMITAQAPKTVQEILLTTHPMSSPVKLHTYLPPDGRRICPLEIQRITFVCPRICPIPPTKRSLPSIHLIQQLISIPRLLVCRHVVFMSLAYTMHPKDEGGQCSVLCTFTPQQLHSRAGRLRMRRTCLE